MDRRKLAAVTGISVIVFAWAVIGLSMYLNPWFSPTHGALSDLGGGTLSANGHPAPSYPYVYNVGLMITGILIMILSSIAISLSGNKVETVGESFFIIAGLFLALIGIYHEGTYPHDFVSIWFFMIATGAYFVIGISMLKGKIRKFGAAITAIVPAAWIIYAIVPWQSTAEDEIFGVVVIDILIILHILSGRRLSIQDQPSDARVES